MPPGFSSSMAENTGNGETANKKTGLFSRVKTAVRDDYLKNYKRNLVIVAVFAAILLFALAFNFLRTGELFKRDISLKGGVAITLSRPDAELAEVQAAILNDYPNSDINLRLLKSAGISTGILIESSDLTGEQIISSIKSNMAALNLVDTDYTVETMGASLGAAFFRQTVVSILLAFALMALTVFIYFKVPIPSLFVVLCAFFDLVGTIAVISFSGIRISSAGVAALLVLIGYSVTSDILLTARVLHGRYDTINENVLLALKTGMTMTLTTIASLLAGYIFAESEVIKQIMLIMVIGLCFDMIFTWLMNVGILRMYVERKEKAHSAKGE
jgi:preprotein translocase subunit SecF